MRIGTFLLGLLLLAPPAFAQSVGLFIGNQDYRSLTDVKRADRVARAVDGLQRSGMQVITRRDATQQDMLWALSEFGQMAANADTLVVGLSGRFVTTSTETYFMPVDGQAGPLATMAAQSLPLSTVFAWLAAHPGDALLILSSDTSQAQYSPLLQEGFGDLEIPQGVTVVIGGPRDLTKFMQQILPRAGRPFVGAARQLGLEVMGYAPMTHVLIDASEPVRPTTADDRRTDILDWRAASGENTVAAYERYLEAHPDGEFARMAENRIRTQTDTPEARAERGEQALDLSRDARRDIQRDLTLLGFNTRGIDGIFGRGTRKAIADWQKAERLSATGYMSADEITALDTQAERRSLELEAEAERRRQELLTADLAYWDDTGSGRDERGLRLYLERYPDGEFSEVAAERLANIERKKRDQAGRNDRRLWDQVRTVDTIPAYEDYLNRAPNGVFRSEAINRIEELEARQNNSGAMQAAQNGEAAMNLSPRTRQIIESRLKGMGLEPGRVDGVFDDDTRRAIRRYQTSRNMENTGYLSEAVVVQLLADSVRQIFK